MAWAKNGTPYTEASTSDDLDITNLTAKKFNVFLAHTSAASGQQAQQDYTFDNNSNTVYASRDSENGTADGTSTSAASFTNNNGAISIWADQFNILYVVNISGEEKLVISNYIWGGVAGAANAPERGELVAKFVPSPDTDIERIDVNNSSTGSFQINDNLSALGTD